MNFFDRFQGVFFSPQQTFKAISEKPVWIDALITLLVLLAIFTYTASPFLQKDSLQAMKDNLKLKERYGEERYNQMIERLENTSQTTTMVRSFLATPFTFLIGFLFSSLIILALGRLFSAEGNYRQVFTAYLHANFIDKILGNSLRLVLVLSRKSFAQITTSLALLFPKLEMTSKAYVVVSQVDFFQIWLFGIFALALSTIFKIKMKKALLISYSFWLLKSLIYVVLGFLSLSYFQ